MSQYILPDTGHLFMAHKSLPAWVQHVVTFLSAHHLDPSVVLPQTSATSDAAPRGSPSTSRRSSCSKFPLHFEVTGTLQLWSGMSPAQWCGGFVDVKVGATTEKPTTARTPVHKDCTFTEGIHVAGKPQAGKARFLRLRFRFAGNGALQGGATRTFPYRLPSS